MEHTFVILFALASIVAIAVSRTRVPYTVALVLVGLVVGAFHIVEPPRLTKEFLFSLCLPGLVFEAAYNLQVRELRRVWRSVALLAGPGIIVAIGLTGGATALALGRLGIEPSFGWRDGLIFAAVVSATDPIAVTSLFRKLGVAPRLTTLVEAESLFNDGTSIVALTLILGVLEGGSASTLGVAMLFILSVLGGGAIGGAIGFAITRLTRWINDAMIEITLTMIGAYGSFVIAEDLHLSGVIATVTAGLVLGNVARSTSFSAETRITADAFWRYIAFALNSIVFLLIGFEVRPTTLLSSGAAIAAGFITVLAARAAVVFAVRASLIRTTERFSASWATLITWGGLRGALAMVLVLALPTTAPHRALLIDMTFGVVLVSLLLQGLTIPLLTARFAHVDPADDGAGQLATARADR